MTERTNSCGSRARWRQWCRQIALALLLVVSTGGGARGSQETQKDLARAQEILDAGNPQAALELLDDLVKRTPPSAEAFLVRSTALFMLGDTKLGERDLARALELDPSLRQAWLNKAALELSEERYDEALSALETARKLDPSAPDNDLNIGAVLLMQGRLEDATASFRSYLERHASSAEAFYLVASNYARAGYAGPAIEHLRPAIELDEKVRLRARTDQNFRDLEDNSRYQSLLEVDSYSPPPGAHLRVFQVETPFSGPDGLLLRAVLDALQFSGQIFDRRVEVTPNWALIWGEIRIKLSDTGEGRGLIQCSAPPDRFTPSQWQERTDTLIREITLRLHTRSR